MRERPWRDRLVRWWFVPFAVQAALSAWAVPSPASDLFTLLFAAVSVAFGLLLFVQRSIARLWLVSVVSGIYLFRAGALAFGDEPPVAFRSRIIAVSTWVLLAYVVLLIGALAEALEEVRRRGHRT